jgi:hypothetical protein
MIIPDNLDPVHVERMELRLTLGATVTVYDATGQATDWIKPATEVAVWWNGVPPAEELLLRYNDLVTAAKITLEDVIGTIRARLEVSRRGQ